MCPANDDTPPSYDIGYRRPPLHSRFQPGQSGNPKGKIKGQQNLKSELLDELRSKVPVVEEGKRRLLSKQSIIVKRMVSDAAKGDAKARDQLLRLLDQMEKAQPAARTADPIGDAHDVEVLARFRAELVKSIEGSKP